MNLLRLIALTIAGAMALWGQAAVESAIGTGAAAGAAGSLRNAGKSTSGVLGRAAKTLDAGAKQGGSKAASGAKSSASAKKAASPQVITLTAAPGPAAAPKAIDPAVIVEGLTRAEVKELAGDPVSRVQQTRRGSFVETLWFETSDGDELRVELVDGKVSSTSLRYSGNRVTAESEPRD